MSEATRDLDHDHHTLIDEDYADHAEFRYAIRRFIRFSEQQARTLGLTPQQHMLLLSVRGHPSYPAVNITEIAERLQIRHHSASLLVERGVKNGWLTRDKDPTDRRRVMVSLTDKGEHALTQITQANRQELRALDDALVRIRSSLRRALRATHDERAPRKETSANTAV